MDFVFDATIDGQPLKWLTVHDEYTRECLAIHVDRRIDHHAVMDVLLDTMVQRGKPAFLVTTQA
jgi:transposase InsO family protein